LRAVGRGFVSLRSNRFEYIEGNFPTYDKKSIQQQF